MKKIQYEIHLEVHDLEKKTLDHGSLVGSTSVESLGTGLDLLESLLPPLAEVIKNIKETT